MEEKCIEKTFLIWSFYVQERKTVSSTPGGLIEEYLSREKRTETDAGLPITTITTHRTYTTNSAPGET